MVLRSLLPRLAALWLLAMGAASFGQAVAQAPPAVPALPDSERRTSYSLTASTCACNVNFALFGSGTDVDSWIEVWVAGTRYLSTDLTFGWSLSSATGPLATIPRPITNAVLTFNAVQTGTVQIVGAERPRRLSQFSENRGVAARDLNQAISDLIAINRETWDKTNDLAGRTLQGPPGDTVASMVLAPAATRAGQFFTFDAFGAPALTSPGIGLGNVVGPASSVNNHIAVFSGTTGKLLVDGGSIGSTTLTGDVTGSGTVTFATALATVNTNVGSFGSASNCLAITVNGKGLITAASQTACIPAASPVLDQISPTQGSILYRDASAWLALAPGSGGQVLSSGGPAANPSWQTISGTGTVTNATVAAGVGAAVSGTCAITTTGTCTVAVDATYLQGFIGGLVMSNDGGTPNTLIDSAAGVAVSDDATTLMKAGAFTKNTNAAWAVGAATGCLDSGTGLVLSTWYHLYVIERTDTAVVDQLCSMAPPSLTQALASISNASPAVATLSGHGLQVGQPVKFTTTGALPTGLTVGTQYYVIAAGFSATAFEVSASCTGTGCSTGTAVNTSGAGSGTHSVVTTAILPTSYTKQRRIGSFKTDASAHILAFKQDGDYFRWKASVRDVSTANPGSSAITETLASVPGGINVSAIINALLASGSGNNYGYFSDLAANDEAASSTNVPGAQIFAESGQFAGAAGLEVRTNTSQQVRFRQTGSNASDSINIITLGWRDPRGK